MVIVPLFNTVPLFKMLVPVGITKLDPGETITVEPLAIVVPG
jgi:hypothetical protein